MRCPVCTAKTSDITGHIKRCHPQYDQSSDESFDDSAEDPDYIGEEGEGSGDSGWKYLIKKKNTSTPKGKAPAKKLSLILKGKAPAKKITKKGKAPAPSKGKRTKAPVDEIPAKIRKKNSSEQGSRNNTVSKKSTTRKEVAKENELFSGTMVMEILEKLAQMQQQLHRLENNRENSEKHSTGTEIIAEKMTLCARKTKGGKRKRKVCPFCPSSVCNLPRHLRMRHNFSYRESLDYMKRNRDKLSGKSKRKYKKCPVKNFGALVTYVPKHLRAIHKMSPSESRNKSKKARLVSLSSELNIQRESDQEASSPLPSEKTDSPHECKENEELQKQQKIVDKKLAKDTNPSVASTSREWREPVTIIVMSDSDDDAHKESTLEKNNETVVEQVTSSIKELEMQPKKSNVSEGHHLKAAKIKIRERVGMNVKRQKSGSWRGVSTLREFNRFLVGLQRKMSERQASQTCAQMFTIWSKCDPLLLFRIGPITNPERILIFLDRFSKVAQPGTVKAYLTSIKEFWTYLLIKKIIRQSKFSELIAHRSLWMKSLRRSTRERKHAIMLRDTLRRIPVSEMKTFRSSKVGEKVEKLLNSDIATSEDWNLIIAYLVLMIGMNNGQRCGAVANITMRIFANRVKDGNSYVVTLGTHKTSENYQCNLTINNKLYNLLVRYLSARHKIADNKPKLLEAESPLFISFTGTEISSSNFTKIINRAWKIGGCRSHVTFTLLRKGIVSRFREVKPSSRVDLARHMTHAVSTSDTYYAAAADIKKAREISQTIEDVIDASSEPVEAYLSSEDAIAGPSSTNLTTPRPSSSDNAIAGPSSAEDTIVRPPSNTLKGDSNIQSVTESQFHSQDSDDQVESQNASISSVSKHGRRTFTSEESNLIKKYCKAMAAGTCPITQQTVYDTIVQYEDGRALIDRLTDEFGRKSALKKIADRLRTFRRDMNQK